MVYEIFEEVIVRFLKLGARQFLRDFRRDYHVKKSLAHRKAITKRKERPNEKPMKVHFHQNRTGQKSGQESFLCAFAIAGKRFKVQRNDASVYQGRIAAFLQRVQRAIFP